MKMIPSMMIVEVLRRERKRGKIHLSGGIAEINNITIVIILAP
jgi:hypothetical protein